MMSSINWYKYSSPATFYGLAGKMIPWFLALTLIFGAAGLWLGEDPMAPMARLALAGQSGDASGKLGGNYKAGRRR